MAAKNEHAEAVAQHLETAEAAAAGQTGITKIVHTLDVAFVHALAGAGDKAKELIADAEAEIAKYAPNFKHLEADISVLLAKVHAVLAGKSSSSK